MFTLLLRSEIEGVDVPYPEGLIHRTKRGTLLRSKSEVIVANVLEDLDLTWEYEQKLSSPDNPRDFRLPDFKIGFQGDIFYWEHLGILHLQSYRESWERKRRWYEERMGIPVVGPGAADPSSEPEEGTTPLVITSRDDERGGIDQTEIYRLARKYILLEE